ncbi:hypothetical protein FQN60_016087 [Etheostoma spectabile]|uniref:Uncharacterized protein n=1 Tax=Etheostoma spectabile TaxID=54343 RepID=A0A5J5D3V9_9PERO|nr:hypothetical protein FQN60_016087 [Etheostoma spectabile]
MQFSVGELHLYMQPVKAVGLLPLTRTLPRPCCWNKAPTMCACSGELARENAGPPPPWQRLRPFGQAEAHHSRVSRTPIKTSVKHRRSKRNGNRTDQFQQNSLSRERATGCIYDSLTSHGLLGIPRAIPQWSTQVIINSCQFKKTQNMEQHWVGAELVFAGTVLHVYVTGVCTVSQCWRCVFTGNKEYPRAPFSAWLRLQEVDVYLGPPGKLVWACFCLPVCTFIHHVIMCQPWLRQLWAKADPVIGAGSGSKITGVWSSCYQRSADPQWFACVRGVGELKPFLESCDCVSGAQLCCGERTDCVCCDSTGSAPKRFVTLANEMSAANVIRYCCTRKQDFKEKARVGKKLLLPSNNLRGGERRRPVQPRFIPLMGSPAEEPLTLNAAESREANPGKTARRGGGNRKGGTNPAPYDHKSYLPTFLPICGACVLSVSSPAE